MLGHPFGNKENNNSTKPIIVRQSIAIVTILNWIYLYRIDEENVKEFFISNNITCMWSILFVLIDFAGYTLFTAIVNNILLNTYVLSYFDDKTLHWNTVLVQALIKTSFLIKKNTNGYQ